MGSKSGQCRKLLCCESSFAAKCAAAKSSYGPGNAAAWEGRENAWMARTIFFFPPSFFFGIKMQREIRDLALNEQGLSFSDFFLRDSNKLLCMHDELHTERGKKKKKKRAGRMVWPCQSMSQCIHPSIHPQCVDLELLDLRAHSLKQSLITYAECQHNYFILS